jgi:poly-beta-1,6-N-acetyl-D-glucosamine synthase
MTEPAHANVDRPGRCSYVLITPARNEAAFIELTIRSVVGQTVLPLKWVIVSDGSTDGTDDIVKRYAAGHPWIELLRMPERKERHFAGKVNAFNEGYTRVKDLEYEILGSLDGDISFEADYFEFLLGKFAENKRLGVAGTPFSEEGAIYDYRFASTEHVSGACQLFRRQCFESIGGYVPLKVGGIDLVAVTTARLKGWQTRTFTEKVCLHLKRTQTGKHKSKAAIFKSGFHDYLMGGHPAWQFFRSVYSMGKHPFSLGGGTLLVGYLWAMVMRAERPVSAEFVKFRRKEQMARLKEIFRSLLLKRGLRHS